MSSSIWTRCAGDSEIRALRLEPWRAVEAQHQLSTRKLVASADEQALLEELIDRAKPPNVSGTRLHYLLATPFRYPPLRWGSRFGTKQERGIWYGSETRRAMFAEVSFYRLVFLEGTHADLGTLTTTLTAFRVSARSAKGIDLVAPPFAAHQKAIASPVSYSETQPLGRAMRDAGVALFRYPSARDSGGINVGAFTPAVFGRSKPRDLETWYCTANKQLVELAKRDYFGREVLAFSRATFLVSGRLPLPDTPSTS
ncbi:MAG TPA: RES family NAD+ phosphorylase [Gemmatimonadaceae bacterium]|nr:RES family NAD+ phosphorylase [Gemmatimonadaceae bacterium]